MTLAAVQIAPSEFERIRDHLVSHKPPYRTMHLREARVRNKKRTLRYLHAMHTTPADPLMIEGMISGPGAFWHYRITNSRGQPQLNVLAEHGPGEELARIGRSFLPKILARIDEEQAGSAFHPTYLAGEFYLRRRRGGIHSTHAHCQLALNKGVLNAKFVSKLASWDLELLCP